MGSPRKDFDLLLEAVDPIRAEMARGLLEAEGIPSLLHNRDFDVAELGRAAHDVMRRPDVYVPRGTLERARSVLEEAWGPPEAAEPFPELQASRGRRRRVQLGVLLALIIVPWLTFAVVALLRELRRGQ